MLAATYIWVWCCLISVIVANILGVIGSHSRSGRRIAVPARLGNKISQCEIAKYLRYFAEETRRLNIDKYPDLYDPEISPLECLTRLAILASKPSATAEQITFVDEWADWWDYTHANIPHDSRSNADRLLAYTIERKTQYLKPTLNAAVYEADLVARIRSSDEANLNQRRPQG